MWVVRYLEEAAEERSRLSVQEMNAMDRAVDELEAFGPRLPYPHQSDVREATGIRELRPRAGRSPWRALYTRVGSEFVIGAIGPEAEANRQGFRRAVRATLRRLESYGGQG
jgi:hypothetical protein